MSNAQLHKAKAAKNDEFYTCLEDIENELQHYEEQFKDKVIYCNCDNPEWSKFYTYFADNAERLEIKKLITCYIKPNGDGDFRSDESIELLKEADIVVTNPPFSLFREYVAQLIEYDKKFLILGNQNAVAYNEIFKLFKDDMVQLGYNSNKGIHFKVPAQHESVNEYVRVPAISWFTNLDNSAKFGNIGWFTNLKSDRGCKDLVLHKTYNPVDYPKCDNYDIINVDRVKDIPKDYYSMMAVPITFMDRYDSKRFEIIDKFTPIINGKMKYTRIIIKRLQEDE